MSRSSAKSARCSTRLDFKPWHATVIALTCALAACEDNPTAAPAPVLFSVVSGNQQVGSPGSTLPNPLVVRAEVNGQPKADEVVVWAVTQGGGSVYAGVSRTDSKGEAREWWTLGDEGPQTVEVRAVDPTTGERRVYARFQATAKAELPAANNVPPVASFSFSCVSLACQFTDTSSDQDGSVTSRTWNFGDGSSSAQQNPSHQYGSAGSYTVALTVKDDDGATSTTVKTVTVSDGPAPPAPAGWDREIRDATINGNLVIPAGQRWLIGPNVKVAGNVLVQDAVLGMRPGSSLTIVGADPAKYVGGGLHYTPEFENDRGVWVWGSGQLDIACTPKTSWNRTGVDPTWLPTDEYWIAPTNIGDFKPRRWTPGQPIPRVDPRVPATEVMNVTRDCTIKGPGHIHVNSSKPSRVEYVRLENLGIIKNGDSVTGRYALHFHMQGEGSRGTIVRGVAIVNAGGKAFVPHTSHGVTMIDNVTVNSAAEGLWWDEGHVTRDLMVDRLAVSGATSAGATLGSTGEGRTTTIRNSAVSGTGATGSDRGVGYDWNTVNPHRIETRPLWNFDEGNVAHNNVGFGIRFWVNESWPHHVQNYVSYRNGRGGLETGAYGNSVRYTNVILFQEGHRASTPGHLIPVAAHHHAGSKPQSEDGGPSRYTNVQFISLDGPALLLGIMRFESEVRQEYIDCTLVAGPNQPKVVLSDKLEHPPIVLFRRCNLTPDEVRLPSVLTSAMEGTSIKIEHTDGRRWEIRIENGQRVVR